MNTQRSVSRAPHLHFSRLTIRCVAVVASHPIQAIKLQTLLVDHRKESACFGVWWTAFSGANSFCDQRKPVHPIKAPTPYFVKWWTTKLRHLSKLLGVDIMLDKRGSETQIRSRQLFGKLHKITLSTIVPNRYHPKSGLWLTHKYQRNRVFYQR